MFITFCFMMVLKHFSTKILFVLLFINPRMTRADNSQNWMIEENGIYKHINWVENVDSTPNGATTLHEVFLQSVKISPNSDFLGTIKDDKVIYASYLEIYNKVRIINKFLRDLGIKEKSICGIFSTNREEWFISEQAILMLGGISCPLYSTLGKEAVKHILEETEMENIFLSGDKPSYLIDNIFNDNTLSVKRMFLFDQISSSEMEKLESANIEIHFFSDIYANSKINKLTIKELEFVGNNTNNPVFDTETKKTNPNDVITICYTSGTSGLPKGAMLTNSNFISVIAGFTRGHDDQALLDVDRNVVYISYLPLAHVMEKVCFYVVVSVNAKIGFFSGNRKRLQLDMKIIKPTMLPGVPRVFDMMKERILQKIKARGIIASIIFNLALKYKLWRQKNGHLISNVLDFLIFKKIKNEFGGCFRFGLSASAPLNPDVSCFFQAIFSMRIYEAYGQTEALAANMLQPIGGTEPGSVGIPFPSMLVKLEKTDKPGQSEILLKGQNVFKGYYKKPERTKEAIDKNGWLHTGDIGEVRNNIFFITGRIKDIFKISLGEYIVPELLEQKLKLPCVDDLFITGKDLVSFIVCLAFVSDSSSTDEEIIEKIIENAKELAEKGDINAYEVPRHVKIVREELTIDNNMITVTAKKCRSVIATKYEKEIELMYTKDSSH